MYCIDVHFMLMASLISFAGSSFASDKQALEPLDQFWSPGEPNNPGTGEKYLRASWSSNFNTYEWHNDIQTPASAFVCEIK